MWHSPHCPAAFNFQLKTEASLLSPRSPSARISSCAAAKTGATPQSSPSRPKPSRSRSALRRAAPTASGVRPKPHCLSRERFPCSARACGALASPDTTRAGKESTFNALTPTRPRRISAHRALRGGFPQPGYNQPAPAVLHASPLPHAPDSAKLAERLARVSFARDFAVSYVFRQCLGFSPVCRRRLFRA